MTGGKSTYCADEVLHIYSVDFSSSLIFRISAGCRCLHSVKHFNFASELPDYPNRKIGISSLFDKSYLTQLFFSKIWFYVVDQQTKCFVKHREFSLQRKCHSVSCSFIRQQPRRLLYCQWFIVFVNSFISTFCYNPALRSELCHCSLFG